MTKSTTPSSTPLHWSRTAIASAVLAVMGFASLWLVIGLFLAAAGAVCGHVARFDTLEGGIRGRRLATFGVFASYFSMLSFPVLLIVASLSFPAFSMWQSERNASQRESSQVQASRLFLACEAYSRSNRGRYPAELKALSGRFIGGKELRDALQSPYEGGSNIAFELVPHDRPVLDAIADSVIVIQEIAPSTVKEIAVVYADGTVKSIHNPDYQSP
ncbi:MAG: DUF4190 domain-containing protein [Verrucomicrobiales bacterium]|nr:DUF4190 domain-containing protein [Verrucomicrobiales bacterium]